MAETAVSREQRRNQRSEGKNTRREASRCGSLRLTVFYFLFWLFVLQPTESRGRYFWKNGLTYVELRQQKKTVLPLFSLSLFKRRRNDRFNRVGFYFSDEGYLRLSDETPSVPFRLPSDEFSVFFPSPPPTFEPESLPLLSGWETLLTGGGQVGMETDRK